MFATDYPHFDSSGGALDTFLAVDGLTDADQHKILWENSADFYALKTALPAC